VYENPVVEKGLSVQAVGWAFTHAQVSNWIPLTTLSHMLDCQIFGLHAGGHHLVNVLLHAATAVLLFLVLRQMTGSLWRSAFVAAVFAVHPLRAESVAWVSERKDVLSAFFFMLTIGAYVRKSPCAPAPVHRSAGLCAVLVFFVLGLMSKSMVATLPFVLLLLDYWPLKRISYFRSFSAECRPISGFRFETLADREDSVVCPGGGIVRGDGADAGTGDCGCPPAPALRTHWQRAGFLCGLSGANGFSGGIGHSLSQRPNGQPRHGRFVWHLSCWRRFSAGVVAWRKKQSLPADGLALVSGMLFPVIGIIQISADVAHADHYTYLPEIGLAIAVTWAVADWSAGWKHRRLVLGGLMAAVIGALMVAATSRLRIGKTAKRCGRGRWTAPPATASPATTWAMALAENGDVEGSHRAIPKGAGNPPG
jgi:hypothetical protein